MSRIFKAASIAAIAMTATGTLLLTEPTFASGSTLTETGSTLTETSVPATMIPTASEPVEVDPVADTPSDPVAAPDAPAPVRPAPINAASLDQLVASHPVPAAMDDDLRCLASTVYFESKGESLVGQLAVAHVVLNRAKSGRFASTICGVVHQRSQFSFVRGGRIPALNTTSRDWREAVAIAQIARDGSWHSAAPGALFFHASRVSPGWRKARVARIDNHIFYR